MPTFLQLDCTWPLTDQERKLELLQWSDHNNHKHHRQQLLMMMKNTTDGQTDCCCSFCLRQSKTNWAYIYSRSKGSVSDELHQVLGRKVQAHSTSHRQQKSIQDLSIWVGSSHNNNNNKKPHEKKHGTCSLWLHTLLVFHLKSRLYCKWVSDLLTLLMPFAFFQRQQSKAHNSH